MDNVTTCKRVELPNTPSNITAASVPAASLKMVITSSIFEYQKTVPTGTVSQVNDWQSAIEPAARQRRSPIRPAEPAAIVVAA